MSFLETVTRNKIVCIARGVSSRDILKTAEALYEGGIRMMEVTFDQSSSEGIENTMESIRILAAEMKGKMQIGAGTVLTPEQVQSAYDAGGTFIVTPNTNVDVIRKAKELNMGMMIGAFSPTEAELAYRTGADVVKLFPVVSLGTGYIKNIRGPLGYIPYSCVGGVNLDNVADFFAAGCCSAGIGGNLVDRKAIEAGNFGKLTETARQFCERVL